jgi:hypothetical protein
MSSITLTCMAAASAAAAAVSAPSITYSAYTTILFFTAKSHHADSGFNQEFGKEIKIKYRNINSAYAREQLQQQLTDDV